MLHKKQHYIPQTYLKVWCDPDTPINQEPYVWIFSKDGQSVKNRPPKKILYETDFYTIQEDEGQRNLSIEHNLSQLEGLFTQIRDTKLTKSHPLTDNEHINLCMFVAAMSARTKSQRTHIRDNWQRVLDMANRVMELDQNGAFREQVGVLPNRDEDITFSIEDVEQIVQEPIQSWLPANILGISPLLAQIDLLVINTSTRPGFITSDHPCVWFDPEISTGRSPLRAPGLASPFIEITLPISPNQILLFNKQGLNGYLNIKDNSLVEELNRRTRHHAYEFFIVNENTIKQEWFQ